MPYPAGGSTDVLFRILAERRSSSHPRPISASCIWKVRAELGLALIGADSEVLSQSPEQIAEVSAEPRRAGGVCGGRGGAGAPMKPFLGLPNGRADGNANASVWRSRAMALPRARSAASQQAHEELYHPQQREPALAIPVTRWIARQSCNCPHHWDLRCARGKYPCIRRTHAERPSIPASSCCRGHRDRCAFCGRPGGDRG